MTKTMGDASKIMGKIASLTNVNEIAAIATNMQTNLTKMGVVGEMVEDAMEDLDTDTVGDDQVGLLVLTPASRKPAQRHAGQAGP